jgi:hypothetical protein
MRGCVASTSDALTLEIAITVQSRCGCSSKIIRQPAAIIKDLRRVRQSVAVFENWRVALRLIKDHAISQRTNRVDVALMPTVRRCGVRDD